MTRAALYARVSTPASNRKMTKSGDRERQDPEVQLLKLRAYAQARGWEIVDEYVDRKSGADPNRPALQRLMNDAFAHKFDTVLVTRIDRFARSLVNLETTMNKLDSWEIGVIFIDQQMDTRSPSGKLMFQIFGAFAEFEREMIRERVMDGLEKAKADGKQLGRPARKVNLDAYYEALKVTGSGRKAAEVVGIPYSTIREHIRRRESQIEQEDSAEKGGSICL